MDVKETLQKVYMSEVQSHGFGWEKEILSIYGATNEEIKDIKYTSVYDLPASLNRLNGCNLSVKVSGKENTVCMADCLRVYDEVSSDIPIHMIVINYIQEDTIKRVTSITEVDLTNSVHQLFGSLSRDQIDALDKEVKKIPQKRKPTPEEYYDMYVLRDSLQRLSGALHLDIKCNSTQSRVQCSFNHFQKFIENNPDRVISKSITNEFRGGFITAQIQSARRVFKKRIKDPVDLGL